MKRWVFVLLILVLLFTISTTIVLCAKLLSTSDKHKSDINFSSYLPENTVEMYDNSIVIEEEVGTDDTLSISYGTEDELDVIVTFYKAFFFDNDIQLQSQTRNTDIYNAQYIHNGFEIEINIEVAKSEYKGENFNSVVYISAVKSDVKIVEEKESIEQDAQTITYEDSGNESESIGLSPGTYEFIWSDYDEDLNDTDTIFEIYDNTTGAMYFFDLDKMKFKTQSFTYTYSFPMLIFYYEDGTEQSYSFSYTESGEIVLREYSEEDVTSENVMFYEYLDGRMIFTSFGSWVMSNDDGTYGSICYWKSGRGYADNWIDLGYDYDTFEWVYTYGVLQTTYDNSEVYGYEYFVEHMGDVTVISNYDEEFTLYRANADLIEGKYILYDSDDPNPMIGEFELYEYGDGNAIFNENGKNVEYDLSYWHIDSDDGKIYFYKSYDDYVAYDYFYKSDGLLLFDEDTGYSYDMKIVKE